MPKSEIDLTSLLARFGAFLSTTLLLCWQVLWPIWKGKRRVQVKGSIAFVGDAMGARQKVIAIEIVNIGYRPIQIGSVALEFTDRTKLVMLKDAATGKSPFFERLDQHDRMPVYFDYARVEKKLKERPDILLSSALVRDVEGKLYRSRLPKQLEEAGLARRAWWRRFRRR